MNDWIDCEECKSAMECDAKSWLCHKHQVEFLGDSHKFRRPINEPFIQPMRPKQDMEIIIERLDKIERRLSEMSPIRPADVDKLIRESKDKMEKLNESH